jgi:signal transduction histidine kinase
MATAMLVICSFIMLSVAFIILGRSYLITEYREKMDRNADEVSRTASALSVDGNVSSWNLRLVITSISTSSGNHIFITNPEGTIVLCSDREYYCEHMGQQMSRNVMELLQSEGGIDQLSNLDGFYSGTRFVVAKPIDDPSGNRLGYVFVSSDTTNIVGAYRTFLWVSMAMVCAVVLLALMLSLFYSKKMSEPLDEIALASRRFAHGDFSVRVENKGQRTDELGTLIDSFNEMADSLENSEKHRQEFIANISHELRTPMTTIAGFANGILDGTIPKEDENRYLKAIADETNRLSRLVRNMLDVSRMQAQTADKTRRKNFDLTELMLETLLSFERRTADKKIDVDLQLPENHFFVYADPDAITQVIYNLMDNAIKFAFPGSTITVRLYRSGNKAYVSIKDRGQTIPQDDLPYIFDRFHKSDRSRSIDKEGVGLGLYLVKTIINNHDEDIAVNSKDNVTEFVFTLTMASEPEKAPEESEAAGDRTKKGKPQGKKDKRKRKKPEKTEAAGGSSAPPISRKEKNRRENP